MCALVYVLAHCSKYRCCCIVKCTLCLECVWSSRCVKKKATVITTLSSDSSVSHTRSTTVDHLPGKQRGNHKVFHIFWWFSDNFFVCLSSESHPIYTRRPLIPGEQRGNHEIFHDFPDDFAIIFSSVSSLSHKGIHEDIIYYHSILFPINFFLRFSHVFFCFLSVSYRVFF